MQKKVVHTRMSDEMYDQLSKNAKKRRVTISNLVRNIVEDSLDLSGEVFNLVDEKLRKRLHREDAILGYQSITLSKDTVCDFCGKDVIKGTSVNLAFLENSAKRPTVCDECKRKQEAEE
jgi:predicted DNA-binding protein